VQGLKRYRCRVVWVTMLFHDEGSGLDVTVLGWLCTIWLSVIGLLEQLCIVVHYKVDMSGTMRVSHSVRARVRVQNVKGKGDKGTACQ